MTGKSQENLCVLPKNKAKMVMKSILKIKETVSVIPFDNRYLGYDEWY